MESVGAVLIHPFSYRNRLLGFLILNEAPRNRHAARALDFFGDKAAVSIQNYILSNRIIDSRLYDQELRSAQKIQSTLHDAPIPEIPGFRLRRRDHQSCILEFIPAGRDGRWFLVGLTLDRITSAGGIILYGLLGHLYSFITREKNVTMHRLHSYLRKHREQTQADYPVDIVIAELVPKKRAIVLMSDGSNYNLRSLRDPNQPLVTRGWRNSLELSPGDGMLLSHAGSPLLELHYADLTPTLAAAIQQNPSREV
jgi:hypothetical protein